MAISSGDGTLTIAYTLSLALESDSPLMLFLLTLFMSFQVSHTTKQFMGR